MVFVGRVAGQARIMALVPSNRYEQGISPCLGTTPSFYHRPAHLFEHLVPVCRCRYVVHGQPLTMGVLFTMIVNVPQMAKNAASDFDVIVAINVVASGRRSGYCTVTIGFIAFVLTRQPAVMGFYYAFELA
jgi:hypothetical protein